MAKHITFKNITRENVECPYCGSTMDIRVANGAAFSIDTFHIEPDGTERVRIFGVWVDKEPTPEGWGNGYINPDATTFELVSPNYRKGN